MQKWMKSAAALLLAVALCLGMGTPAAAYSGADAQKKAEALSELGLFKGTDKGFELNRAPTRMEAVIMLIRMMGAEWDALYGEYKHPFTDAPGWEDAGKYLGYAYEKGLTKGVSAKSFDPQGVADAQVYLTFMLRALGYQDSASGTVWSRWKTLSQSAGLLPAGVSTAKFQRGDAALVSYAALDAKMQGKTGTLADSLMAGRTFSAVSLGKARILAGTKATSASSLELVLGAVYQGVDSQFVRGLSVTALTKDNLSSFLGVKSLSFTEGLAAEPMMSSVAHSVVVVRVASGVDVAKAKADIKASVNPNKWVCVGVDAKNVRVESIGSLILLVMDNQEADTMVSNFRALSK